MRQAASFKYRAALTTFLLLGASGLTSAYPHALRLYNGFENA